MPVVIRLMRAGAKKRPFYRMVAADSRRQRDGRFIEILGHYNPIATPHTLVVEKERVQDWLSKGAQPSEQVAALLRSVGVTTTRPPSAPKKKKQKAAATAEAAPARRSSKKATKKAARATSARKASRKAARKTRAPKQKKPAKK